MKLINSDNPITSTWLAEQGYRLDPRPYLSGAFEARKLLERLSVEKDPLHTLTAGYNGGIFNGPKFRRVYLNSPEYSVPFLGSTDMLEADFSWLPRLAQTTAESFPFLELRPGMTLISCSGTVGRMAFARPDMTGMWSSQHIMKVAPDREKIRPGYLYSFLSSKYGSSLIMGSAYGAIVQHIEPHHIADISVPRFDDALESEIDDRIRQAAQLRASYQVGVVDATIDLLNSAGLQDLVNFQWHEQARDVGFSVNGVNGTSLRALNFSPRAREVLDKMRSVSHRTLGDICKEGSLRTGARFKRVDADPEHGVRLIGQRQAFWVTPQGRWINPRQAPSDILQRDETILVAAHGTLGENEVYGRSILVTGHWLTHAFSQDFVRVLSGCADLPGAYLFALLRSKLAFRIFRSMSVGGKQQEYHTALLRDFPVPLCTPADRERIAGKVRQAYRERDLADDKEDEALRLLDEAVREAAR